MRPEDIPAVVRLHRAVMGYTLNAWLGERNLAHLYAVMIADPGCVALVADSTTGIDGAVTGTTDMRGLSSRLLRCTPIGLKMANAVRILTHPWRLTDLLESFRLQRLAAGGFHAVLTTIFVRPDAGRSGIGNGLFTAFSEALRARNVRSFRLDTLLSNTRARAFYVKMGMHTAGTTRHSILYEISL